MNPPPVVLVTGASRGIGASAARQFAQRGADVVINFRSKAPRAEEVARAIEEIGRRAWLAQADLTSEDQVEAMRRVVEDAGGLDVLVLNASGGMERGASLDYAMQLNLSAQVRVVETLLPSMRRGGRVVFVTSHLAHFYGRKEVPDVYEPVAASKHAGEMALRAMMPRLGEQGVSLVVVSGDMIEGTITPKLMERAQRGTIATRREQAGRLPTVDEFAGAIVEAAFNLELSSGAVVLVGAVD